jgi:hypothetical protein
LGISSYVEIKKKVKLIARREQRKAAQPTPPTVPDQRNPEKLKKLQTLEAARVKSDVLFGCMDAV